jgi:hypothetical protein
VGFLVGPGSLVVGGGVVGAVAGGGGSATGENGGAGGALLGHFWSTTKRRDPELTGSCARAPNSRTQPATRRFERRNLVPKMGTSSVLESRGRCE